ncbi:nicotinate phosphoribosyltransferase, (NAPRTase) family [Ancylostoma caninum]|uniref:Nicotinamide phosphoribosyltransferase n=1 Tax=Ancylostoma caninum TaxID=29170 RepID=A0A368H0D6_ANCCA|nr:nicotinate phosphoribosyltransferase, (NAPRTase) family [Ancylostoma caninum]
MLIIVVSVIVIIDHSMLWRTLCEDTATYEFPVVARDYFDKLVLIWRTQSQSVNRRLFGSVAVEANCEDYHVVLENALRLVGADKLEMVFIPVQLDLSDSKKAVHIPYPYRISCQQSSDSRHFALDHLSTHKHRGYGMPLAPQYSFSCTFQMAAIHRSTKEDTENWTEKTDPKKFVYEDCGIATYLLEYWKNRGRFPRKFADLGCGNGLLVYLLNKEADKNSIPHDVDYLIGNHTDELTPWLPIMAARRNCEFFVLPCCPFNFFGKYVARPGDTGSQYDSFLRFTREICTRLGFVVEEDRLSIPSTKRLCFVCSIPPDGLVPNVEEVIEELTGSATKAFLPRPKVEQICTRLGFVVEEDRLSIPSTKRLCFVCSIPPDGLMPNVEEVIEELTGSATKAFLPRPKVEQIRNCLNIPPDTRWALTKRFFDKILQSSDELRDGWRCGGAIDLVELASMLTEAEKQLMKQQCGGLQTFLRNQHQVFKIRNCLNIPPDTRWALTKRFFDKILQSSDELRDGWRCGGAIDLVELASMLTEAEKQLMKQQCGGLQTFLRNQHQVFKITHHNQYPEGTTNVYSYFESRGGKFPEVCFFGLQYILKRWLVGVVVTHKMIDEAKEFYKLHFNMEVFNEAGWRHIVEKHGGRLPLRIKAVPEGSVVPIKNVLFTIENTDPAVPWLTNWFETLLVQTWYPITVCTSSRAYKQLIARYLEETSDSLEGLPFKLHDFGYRGSTSVESAGIGGAAHLVNFIGTDTIAGLQLCRKYYSCKMAGYSIPAAEHSTITTWKKTGEVAAFRNMLQQYPKGLVSVVSDSYDVFHAVSSIWGEELRDEVIARGERGCLVIRPDSGDPITVVVKVLNLLEEKFPVTKNSKGYKVLPAYLRVIQGDGINYDSTGAILEALKSAGIGGAAHLVNFIGTDTIAGLQLCRKYYSCKMAGYSIPAAEHSTITTWKKTGEVAAFRNMLQQYPKGLVSVVSDSYDVFHAVSSIWGEELRDEVIARGERGCLVIRPDSGDPITVVVKVLNLLEEKFPVTKNSKGYKVLPAYLRVIQGDGINYDSTGAILEALKKAGWSTDNVVFGAGGALLQRIDRDTQKCAFKCSHVIVNGEHRDVYKNPATDEGKRSKKGYLTLVRNASGNLETVQEGQGDPAKDLLQTVFENGHLLVDWTLEEVRERAEIDLVKKSRKTCVNGVHKGNGDTLS